MIMQAISTKTLEIKTNGKLEKLYEWCCLYKLITNSTKYTTLIVPPKLRNFSVLNMDINTARTAIKVIDNA